MSLSGRKLERGKGQGQWPEHVVGERGRARECVVAIIIIIVRQGQDRGMSSPGWANGQSTSSLNIEVCVTGRGKVILTSARLTFIDLVIVTVAYFTRVCILRKWGYGAAQDEVWVRAKRGGGLFFPSGHLFQLEQGSVHGDTSFCRHPPTTPSHRDQKISYFLVSLNASRPNTVHPSADCKSSAHPHSSPFYPSRLGPSIELGTLQVLPNRTRSCSLAILVRPVMREEVSWRLSSMYGTNTPLPKRVSSEKVSFLSPLIGFAHGDLYIQRL